MARPDADALVQEEREAYARWLGAVERLPAEAVRRDGRTLPEVVAHIAAWQRMATTRLDGLVAGELIDAPEIAAFNARLRSRAAGQSWNAIQREAAAAHEAFSAAIGRLGRDTLDAHDGLGRFIVRANGVHHYREHSHDFVRSG